MVSNIILSEWFNRKGLWPKEAILICTLFLVFKMQMFSQIDFLPVQSFETGSRAKLVAVDDINNDGLDDVVLATAYYFDTINDYKVFVFIQNEEGELADPVKYPYPEEYPGIYSMAVGDVNNDSLNDVIIGYDNSMGIYFQNDTGTLNPMQAYIIDREVHSLQVGDLNNDGLADIAVSIEFWPDPFIRIFYQSSTGFETKDFPKPSSQSDEIEIGDINHDGLNDIVLLDGNSDGGIYVFLQNPNGLLDNFLAYIPGNLDHRSLHGIGIGDLNNDSVLDIVATKGGNTPVSKIFVWYMQEAIDSLPTHTETQAYDSPDPVEVYDLNCDGKNEIIIGHGSWDAVTIYQQDSAGQYNTYQVYDAPTNGIEPQGLSIGDINDDGKPDIVFADFTEGLGILVNNSIPTEFDLIDSLKTIQQIFEDTILEEHFLIVQTVDTLMNYQFIQTDSFHVQHLFHVDSFKIDLVMIRTAILCSRPYLDTLFQTQYHVDSMHIKSDTFFISTQVDSTLLTSGYKYAEQYDSLNIYPNPSDQYTTLQMANPVFFSEAIVQVVDQYGKVLIHKVISEPEMQLDISSFPSGPYYILLIRGKEVNVKKLIITR